MSFIDEHREEYGVEPICAVLPIAPSTYFEHRKRRLDPEKRPEREKRDEALREKIQTVWDDNNQVYGVRKIWRHLNRKDSKIARCTVARLMGQMGLQGAVRGKAYKRTTNADPGAPQPSDLVNRRFSAPSPRQLWVADLTYISTWAGFVYAAFIIDVFSRRIVGWRVSRSMTTDLVLEALEQALHMHPAPKGLVHHSDRGSQYLSIRYTQRLAESGIENSVGSKGDSYDNALAESVIGLYKTEVIKRQGPWKVKEQVELETLHWVDWFNNRRLFGPLGYLSPAEFEEAYFANQAQRKAA